MILTIYNRCKVLPSNQENQFLQIFITGPATLLQQLHLLQEMQGAARGLRGTGLASLAAPLLRPRGHQGLHHIRGGH